MLRILLMSRCGGAPKRRLYSRLNCDALSYPTRSLALPASRFAAGFDFVSAYAASKFGLERWMESLSAEIAPFGIHTTVVNPGFFRTELLTAQSTSYAAASVADYDDRRGPLMEFWKSQNGQQSGDPAKLARALLTIAEQNPPPRRFIAGADAVAGAEQKLIDFKAQIESNRELSIALALD